MSERERERERMRNQICDIITSMGALSALQRTERQCAEECSYYENTNFPMVFEGPTLTNNYHYSISMRTKVVIHVQVNGDCTK